MSFQLQEGRFRVVIIKNSFLVMKIVNHWKRFSRRDCGDCLPPNRLSKAKSCKCFFYIVQVRLNRTLAQEKVLDSLFKLLS